MKKTILFLCPHGAAKSVIAEAYFRRAAAARGLDVLAASAGTDPDAAVSPAVADMLRAEGLDFSGHVPRRVTAAELTNAHQVISLGCRADELPAVVDLIHWDEVPAPSQDLVGTRNAILARVERLADELAQTEPGVPHQTYWQIFRRFLHFGLLAWGGPVAQIAMVRQELVDDGRWISPERFNRVLAVYQVLPGPEAHELCVYFGMQARGRLGGLLAGLGFMLPGFGLMFALSWFYFAYGLASPIFAAVFYGFKPAVAALIIRAVHQIGRHALRDRWLWSLAIVAGWLTWAGVNFLITLGLAGLAYALVKRARLSALPLTALVGLPAAAAAAPSLAALFIYGLRTGLLTFGGAYTAIPFLQQDAVVNGAWMTNEQFLDGLALSGILPAPLIIFSTFVGYAGGGPLGALALTAGVFLPAFAFTLVGHHYLEHLIENRAAHAFLDGVTAGVIGLIAVTAFQLLPAAIPNLPALGLFAAALFTLYRWKAKAAVAVVMLGAGLVGLLVGR